MQPSTYRLILTLERLVDDKPLQHYRTTFVHPTKFTFPGEESAKIAAAIMCGHGSVLEKIAKNADSDADAVTQMVWNILQLTNNSDAKES